MQLKVDLPLEQVEHSLVGEQVCLHLMVEVEAMKHFLQPHELERTMLGPLVRQEVELGD